jgi:DNA-binding NtrC family response regulator
MYMKLSNEDRDFFALVSAAAFSNPFGQEREDIDRRIADQYAGQGADLARSLRHLESRLAALESKQRCRITLYDEPDRGALEHAILFDVFHRFTGELDRTIEHQLASERPAPAPFFRDVESVLVSRGFERAAAVRFFAIFYQMRRAFYFIERTLLGQSASMRRLRQSLWNNVFTYDVRVYEKCLLNRMEDFSTILLGETGTGKGTAAAAIGRSAFIPYVPEKGAFAESFTKTFLAINLSQYPASLIESELFGHKKGAFTGAIAAHEGILSQCSAHGAIFLDEIGEVSVPVQIKLLRVLEDRHFSPVGGHERKRFQGRVIAATNRPLDALRREGAFREDFYYRLCSDVLRVPSLRERLAERPDELDDLLPHVLKRMAGEGALALADVVRATILADVGPDYDWPGNVRELEQCVRRALMTRHYVPAPRAAPADPTERFAAAIAGGSLDARELVETYCALLYERHGTYEKVAGIAKLDRRTVKRAVVEAKRKHLVD